MPASNLAVHLPSQLGLLSQAYSILVGLLWKS